MGNSLLRDIHDQNQRPRPDALTVAADLDRAYRDELARRKIYKIASYFHDCLPGCTPGSLVVSDHVPLDGRKMPTCRVLYRKSLRFMAAGLIHRERVFLAANRIGKTETASFEVTCHLTGIYPPWWTGKRFPGPNHWWAAGDTMLTTRDIIQVALLGPHEGVPLKQWTGMIPTHLIGDVTRKSGGVTNCIDTIYVEHAVRTPEGAPQLSSLAFKSYDQGRRVFQGVERHGIWLDEEPPDGSERGETDAQGSTDIWIECLLRTMTTEGLVLATFTPLRGLTPFLSDYIRTAVMPGTEDEDVDARSHFYPDVLDLAGDAAA